MAFEKAKVLKAAEKFLSQGKINAAIKEYRQIVDNDLDDLTALNMLGDLHVRAGQKEEAVLCFERIAEHYRQQEFNLKAIAMYKKIERLKVSDPAIAFKLAELYATQNLVVDARAQYLIVADAYTRAGQNKKALDILHKIADLDPNNIEIRLKVADGYVKENMPAEAVGAFVLAANRLHHIGAHEKSLEAFFKALGIEPDNGDALRGMLEAHIARGTADEAAEVLERSVKDRQDDKELVLMLARAYLEAEDPKGAERAIAMIMQHDASNYTQLLGVARLYLKVGEVDETVRILASVIEQMLAGREERDLLEIVNAVLEHNPDQVGALRMLVRIHWWQRDMDSLRSALERLVDSAQASELDDEERYALTQLVRLAPDEQRYVERLNVLGGLQEETGENFSSSGEMSSGEVPQFETFTIVTDQETIPESAGVQEPAQFESNSVSEHTFSDPTASFADLNENLGEPAIGFQSTGQEFQEVDFGSEDIPTNTPAIPGTDEIGGSRLEMMRQELESVDFYISQGYSDIAADTLEMLERQFGAHPEIVSRREKLERTVGTVAAPADTFEFGDAEELLPAKEEESVKLDAEMPFASLAGDGTDVALPDTDNSITPAKAGLNTELAELFEEFRMAEEEETDSGGDYETHYNMGTAYKEMDLLDEAIQEFQTAAGLVKPKDGTSRFLQCCNMLGHCFMQKAMPRAAVIWFQKGLDAPGHSEDEYQALRYELGSAYEQLGDVDKALRLYTEVYGADVSYREVGSKLRKLEQKK